MVRDPSIVSPSLTGVFIGGRVITNTVQDRGVEVHARAEAVSSPLSSIDGDGGVTDRATRGACSAGSGWVEQYLTPSMGELQTSSLSAV